MLAITQWNFTPNLLLGDGYFRRGKYIGYDSGILYGYQRVILLLKKGDVFIVTSVLLSDWLFQIWLMNIHL